ncbi:signal peptide peptidase SppA [Pseudoalteromonas tunicata]|uniref:signal peptide peptidase SppA n=1 Tax=Pseudoalteromonas tunicata TaxID=314281 RepID=UPI00273E325C|nr:signal peptide peptidase SppA [Pseudoalteromonas tunicata]MDP4982284.1 signal peptide peptidase SppA [Pseudoalteromonas tunicata]MDP5212013.1 signal peptide peptidase SppA [Pseudoalteromonas tunicata]
MIKKFFQMLWNGLNFSRRLIFNILFVVIIISVIVGFSSDDGKVIITPGSALVLNLSGQIVEQEKYVDPLEAAIGDSMGQNDEPPEVLLDDVINVINDAAHNPKISVMVLALQQMQNAHLNKLQEIGAALTEFKAQGKKIIATGDSYTQAQYYLAAYADEISMHPYGWVGVEGYAMYPVYFKDALEKLSISQHIFRVGTFKSAVEPFIRNDMSDAAKLANKEWLGALWLQYKTDVAAQRNFDISNFDESMTTFLEKFAAQSGDSGEYALKNGWVDNLKTKEEVRQDLIKLVGLNAEGKSFNQVSFSDYLSTIKMPFPYDNPLTEKVAVVVAKGNIVDGKRKAGEIGGDSTSALLRKARLDDKVKAVVLRIDSGGGSMFASELIRAEVLALKAAGKPVIASMSSVAASGGYWIASAANEIWAAPSTITGSIGIFGTVMTFENSLARLGVYSDGVSTTEMAGFSPMRELNPQLGNMIQMSIERGYNRFLTIVAEARGMSIEEVDHIAQGRVWIATQAKELGLVDHLGNKQDAIEAAAKLASLDHYDVITVEQTLSPRELFMKEFLSNAHVQSFIAIEPAQATIKTSLQTNIKSVVHQLQQEVTSLEDYNDPNGVYARCLVCNLAQ